MMEIRPCKVEDFVSITGLLKSFHEDALKEYGLNCEADLMDIAIKENYQNALVLVVDGEVVGVIAGKIVDYPLQNKQIFQELVWYVSKKHRQHGKKLLTELENRCKAMGIPMIIMVALGNSMKEKLDNVYKAMGYQELETHYIRVLE